MPKTLAAIKKMLTLIFVYLYIQNFQYACRIGISGNLFASFWDFQINCSFNCHRVRLILFQIADSLDKMQVRGKFIMNAIWQYCGPWKKLVDREPENYRWDNYIHSEYSTVPNNVLLPFANYHQPTNWGKPCRRFWCWLSSNNGIRKNYWVLK